MVTYVKTGPSAASPVGTTGAGTAASMSNNGISSVIATSAEVYVLQPPEFGVEKTIIFTVSTSTALAPVVRGSTAQTVTFAPAMGDNSALPTMMKLAVTRSTNMATVVKMIGVSSVAWAITSVWPVMTTGIGGGSITLSTT